MGRCFRHAPNLWIFSTAGPSNSFDYTRNVCAVALALHVCHILTTGELTRSNTRWRGRRCMHADCVVLCALTAILIRWTIGEHDQGDVAISRNVTQQSTSTSQSALGTHGSGSKRRPHSGFMHAGTKLNNAIPSSESWTKI